MTESTTDDTWLVRSRQLISALYQRTQADSINLMAMSLAYSTLVSLVPFLAVTFSLLKSFGAQQQLEPLLAQALAPLGSAGDEVSRQLTDFVKHLDLGVLGALGLAGLFYTTIVLVGLLEGSLNKIWRVRQARSLMRKFSDYLSVVLVGPIVVVTALALLGTARNSWLIHQLIAIDPFGTVAFVTSWIVPLILLCGFFTFIYRFVPNTSIRLKPALLGGISAGLLWQFMGLVFATFIAGSTQYTAIYSGFAVMILFFLWLYWGWLILLIGAEVSCLLQTSTMALAQPDSRLESHVAQEQTALSLLLAITHRYVNRQSPGTVASLAKELHLPYESIDAMIDRFVKGGILARSADPRGVILAADPSSIQLREVMRCLDGDDAHLPGKRCDDIVARVVAKSRSARLNALCGMNLESLANGDMGPGTDTDLCHRKSEHS